MDGWMDACGYPPIFVTSALQCLCVMLSLEARQLLRHLMCLCDRGMQESSESSALSLIARPTAVPSMTDRQVHRRQAQADEQRETEMTGRLERQTSHS